MSSHTDPVRSLAQRVAADGARPLLTCYDLADGSRVEMSARTFANWVDKTTNLVGSLGLDDAPDVGLPLLLTDPGHWVTMVWAMATWQGGGRVYALPRDDLYRVDLAVVGPSQTHPVPGVETVVCSLHPLGLGLPSPVAGIIDYAEVLSQPDVHWASDAPDLLLDDGTRRWTRDDLAAITPVSERVLLTPVDDPWQMLCAGLLAPLAGGGSVVLVRGRAEAGQLERIAAEEQAQLPQR